MEKNRTKRDKKTTANTHNTVKRQRTKTREKNNKNKQKGKTKFTHAPNLRAFHWVFFCLFVCCVSVYYTVFVFTLYSSAFFFHGVYRICLVWGQFSFICLSLFFSALFGHFCGTFLTQHQFIHFTCPINRIRNVYQVSIQFACVSTFFLALKVFAVCRDRHFI